MVKQARKNILQLKSLNLNREQFDFMNQSKGIINARNNKKVMFGCPLN